MASRIRLTVQSQSSELSSVLEPLNSWIAPFHSVGMIYILCVTFSSKVPVCPSRPQPYNYTILQKDRKKAVCLSKLGMLHGLNGLWKLLSSFEIIQLIFISCESSLKFWALESKSSEKPIFPPAFYHRVWWHRLISQIMLCGHLKSNSSAMSPRIPC